MDPCIQYCSFRESVSKFPVVREGVAKVWPVHQYSIKLGVMFDIISYWNSLILDPIMVSM